MTETYGALTTTSETATFGNCITFYPYSYDGGSGTYVYPHNHYWHVTEPPRDCSGDVHVFPCPHCDKCKCGQATKKAQKAK